MTSPVAKSTAVVMLCVNRGAVLRRAWYLLTRINTLSEDSENTRSLTYHRSILTGTSREGCGGCSEREQDAPDNVKDGRKIRLRDAAQTSGTLN